MNKHLKAKEKYENIDIPEELSAVVKSTIKQAQKERKKRGAFKYWGLGAVAAVGIFAGSINASPALADTLSKVPILSSIVEVLTIHEVQLDEESYHASIETPAIEGLENKDLEKTLNEKYLKESQELYDGFQKDMEDLKKQGGGHLGIENGYEVLTDNDQLLSIRRYTVNTVGSSSTTFVYDTVDKQRGLLLTLPSLFKNDEYITAISTYIQDEMRRQMEQDPSLTYWIDQETFDNFTAIRPDQPFYITDNHKLVISFDKYEVAPGYMGVVTFEIPTSVIKDHLVSEEYISE